MNETTTPSIYTGTCPVCRGLVGKHPNGTLIWHKRYADGAGPAVNQPHTLVPCEGGSELEG